MRGVSIYKRSFNSQSVIPSLEQQELVPNRVGLATLFTDLKTRAGEGLNVTPSYICIIFHRLRLHFAQKCFC